jgi:hypothetical protein
MHVIVNWSYVRLGCDCFISRLFTSGTVSHPTFYYTYPRTRIPCPRLAARVPGPKTITRIPELPASAQIKTKIDSIFMAIISTSQNHERILDDTFVDRAYGRWNGTFVR